MSTVETFHGKQWFQQFLAHASLRLEQLAITTRPQNQDEEDKMREITDIVHILSRDVHPSSIDGQYAKRSQEMCAAEVTAIMKSHLSTAEKTLQHHEAWIRHARRLACFMCNVEQPTAQVEQARKVVTDQAPMGAPELLALVVFYEGLLVQLVRRWRALKIRGYAAGDAEAVEPWHDIVTQVSAYVERVGLYAPRK